MPAPSAIGNLKSAALNRASSDSARLVARKLLPDPKARRRALEVLRDGIARAHEIDGACWGTTLAPNRIRFNVGRGSVLSIVPGGLEWKGSGRIEVENEADVSAPDGWQATLEAAAREFDGSWFSNPPWRAAHSPGVLELLREEFGGAVPTPDYAPVAVEAQSWRENLSGTVAGAGLQLAPRYLATFFTALSLKGLVVLAGQSGTGKTRLATTFAAALPQPQVGEGQAVLDAAFRANGRLQLPAAAARMLSGNGASVTCQGAAHPAKVEGTTLILRGAARKCALELFAAGAPIGVETEIDDAGRANFRLLPLAPAEAPSNHLFVPVRPDWSDGKALLGYFNPLLSRYEWTPFLKFLLRADAGFRAGDGVAYFVILDEMNLARAEHYFADLLSVLETGRDAQGRAREPLRFEFDARAGGDLPPRELFLPPNLYFVGTLNADETTFPLSPKVLDRAWTLEAPPVDFCEYPPRADDFNLAPQACENLNRVFTRDGSFVHWDKSLVAGELEVRPQWRDDLQILNAQLQEHDAGFGFRVFDEIVAFCALARQTEAFDAIEDAFDAAIEAKILPRLSGPRALIEAPLQIIESWAGERALAGTARAAARKSKSLERAGWL